MRRFDKNLKELAKCPKDRRGDEDKGSWGRSEDYWAWKRAEHEEKEYIKSLKNPQDIFDYIEQREEEAFVDNI